MKYEPVFSPWNLVYGHEGGATCLSSEGFFSERKVEMVAVRQAVGGPGNLHSAVSSKSR